MSPCTVRRASVIGGPHSRLAQRFLGGELSIVLLPVHGVDHCDKRIHFYRLSVQQRRPVTPLPHSIQRRLHTEWIAAYHLEGLNCSIRRDDGVQLDSPVSVQLFENRRKHRLYALHQQRRINMRLMNPFLLSGWLNRSCRLRTGFENTRPISTARRSCHETVLRRIACRRIRVTSDRRNRTYAKLRAYHAHPSRRL